MIREPTLDTREAAAARARARARAGKRDGFAGIANGLAEAGGDKDAIDRAPLAGGNADTRIVHRIVLRNRNALLASGHLLGGL